MEYALLAIDLLLAACVAHLYIRPRRASAGPEVQDARDGLAEAVGVLLDELRSAGSDIRADLQDLERKAADGRLALRRTADEISRELEERSRRMEELLLQADRFIRELETASSRLQQLAPRTTASTKSSAAPEPTPGQWNGGSPLPSGQRQPAVAIGAREYSRTVAILTGQDRPGPAGSVGAGRGRVGREELALLLKLKAVQGEVAG